MELGFCPSWNRVLTINAKFSWGQNRPLWKGCLKVLKGILSFMVMVNTRHSMSWRTESMFIYTSTTVLNTWPICKITGTLNWKNTPVNKQNKKSHNWRNLTMENPLFFVEEYLGIFVSKLWLSAVLKWKWLNVDWKLPGQLLKTTLKKKNRSPLRN